MRWALFVILAFALGFGQIARADTIDEHAQQLNQDKNYKVRLSAILWLAKQKDARAVDAVSKALEADSEADIRQIAAKALLRMLSERTPADARSRAFTALQHAADKDKDSTVRRRAKRALHHLADLRAATPTEGQTVAASGKAASAVFVHIGKPALGDHKMPKDTGKVIERAVSDQLAKKLSKRYFRFGTSDAELPTQAELQRDNVRGWYVGATVSEVKVTSKGTVADVRCTVTVRVNPWFGADAQQRLTTDDTAAASGSASIQSANDPRELGYAKRDCVAAVAEQITANRVVPFLEERNPRRRRPSAAREDAKPVRVSRSRSAAR